MAHVLSGRVSLPSREAMEADTQAFYDLMARTGTPVRYTHCQASASSTCYSCYRQYAFPCMRDIAL